MASENSHHPSRKRLISIYENLHRIVLPLIRARTVEPRPLSTDHTVSSHVIPCNLRVGSGQSTAAGPDFPPFLCLQPSTLLLGGLLQ